MTALPCCMCGDVEHDSTCPARRAFEALAFRLDAIREWLGEGRWNLIIEGIEKRAAVENPLAAKESYRDQLREELSGVTDCARGVERQETIVTHVHMFGPNGLCSCGERRNERGVES